MRNGQSDTRPISSMAFREQEYTDLTGILTAMNFGSEEDSKRSQMS